MSSIADSIAFESRQINGMHKRLHKVALNSHQTTSRNGRTSLPILDSDSDNWSFPTVNLTMPLHWWAQLKINAFACPRRDGINRLRHASMLNYVDGRTTTTTTTTHSTDMRLLPSIYHMRSNNRRRRRRRRLSRLNFSNPPNGTNNFYPHFGNPLGPSIEAGIIAMSSRGLLVAIRNRANLATQRKNKIIN